MAGLLPVSAVTTRIRLRDKPGIKPTDRVMHENVSTRIQSVIDLKSGHRKLVLMCEATG